MTASATTVQPATAAEGTDRPPKVLVVDDTPANLVAFRAILSKLNLEIHAVASGHEALSHVLRHDYAVILMDVQMPEIDGYETASLIRDHSDGAPVPIIFITAGDRSEAREFAGYEAGAIDYLFKPVNDKLLISKVRVLTELYEQRRRLATSTEALRRANGQLSGLLRGAAEGIVGISATGMVDFINPAACRLLGVDTSDLLGRPVTRMMSPTLLERVGADFLESAMRAAAETDGIYRNTQTEFVVGDGDPVPVGFSLSAVQGRDGRTTNYVLVFQDITDQLSAQEALRRSAEHDELTGLPNRRIFNRRLADSFADKRRASRAFALLYLDLDGFKPINDRYGHDVGDMLLKTLSWRMSKVLRGDDVLARLGGDEFAAVLPHCDTIEKARQAGDRLWEAVSTPIILDGLELSCGVSIGIAMAPEHGAEPDTLLRCADAAMYAAKQSVDTCIVVSDGGDAASDSPPAA